MHRPPSNRPVNAVSQLGGFISVICTEFKPDFMRILIFVGLLVLGASCYKGKLPYTDPRFGNVEFKQCVISRIDGPDTGFLSNPNSEHLVFTYNNLRDPVQVEPNTVATGSPRWVFYYNPRGDLVTFAGVGNNGTFEFWHNYIYDEFGRISGDSTYIFGIIGNLAAALTQRFSQLSYDRFDRIVSEVKTTNELFVTSPETFTYSYDSKGNLIREGITYDNEANLYLTNKYWRFLARDYSINNPVTYTTYNDHGLPLYRTAGFAPAEVLWTVNGAPVSIQYDCSPGAQGNHP